MHQMPPRDRLEYMTTMSNPSRVSTEGGGEINIENENPTIENNRDRNDTEDTPRFRIGTAILKAFDGITFRGIISKRFDGVYYKITYSDGDNEEMDHEEVEKLLENRNADNYETGQNNTRTLVQTDMHGFSIPEKDSEAFGHNYPSRPFDNSSIITF